MSCDKNPVAPGHCPTAGEGARSTNYLWARAIWKIFYYLKSITYETSRSACFCCTAIRQSACGHIAGRVPTPRHGKTSRREGLKNGAENGAGMDTCPGKFRAPRHHHFGCECRPLVILRQSCPRSTPAAQHRSPAARSPAPGRAAVPGRAFRAI